MFEEFIARVFAARDVAHREHLRTHSLSVHLALGEFYETIIEQVDEIIECYQGEFDLAGEYQVETSPVSNITTWIQAENAWIKENIDAISNGDGSIKNLVEGLRAIYQRTIYKLTKLS